MKEKDFLREIETALKNIYLTASPFSMGQLKDNLEIIIGALMRARNNENYSFNALSDLKVAYGEPKFPQKP